MVVGVKREAKKGGGVNEVERKQNKGKKVRGEK